MAAMSRANVNPYWPADIQEQARLQAARPKDLPVVPEGESELSLFGEGSEELLEDTLDLEAEEQWPLEDMQDPGRGRGREGGAISACVVVDKVIATKVRPKTPKIEKRR